MQITEVHCIVIGQADMPYTCPHQVLQYRAAQSPGANYQHPLILFYPCTPDAVRANGKWFHQCECIGFKPVTMQQTVRWYGKVFAHAPIHMHAASM